MKQLIEARINRLIEVCPTSHLGGFHYPTKGGDGGDDCLWLGLLSTVGIDVASKTIPMCQSPRQHDKGMFYRNPKRQASANVEGKPFFSRDMALGVLCWLIGNKGSEGQLIAKEWLEWIEGNRKCVLKKPAMFGGGCLIRHPMFRYAPDDDGRSDITPTMWALMGRVWRNMGLCTSPTMDTFQFADGDIPVFESEQCGIGYQLHLKAVQAYIKYRLNQSSEYRRKVANICHRRVPGNLFYKVLSQEYATKEDMEYFLGILPDPMTFIPKDYWIWEKGDYESAIKKKQMCGWDMVFMGRLLLEFG